MFQSNFFGPFKKNSLKWPKNYGEWKKKACSTVFNPLPNGISQKPKAVIWTFFRLSKSITKYLDLLRSTLWKNATQQVRFFGSRKRETAVRRDDETESKLVCCSNLLWQLLDKVTPSARFIANNPCANSNNNRYTAPCSFKRVEKTPKSTLTINFNLSSF